MSFNIKYGYQLFSLKAFILLLQLLFHFSLYSIGFIGPDIQCTIIKVIKSQDIMGLKNFPKKYDAIANNGMLSKLSVRAMPFKSEPPFSILKDGLREKILIKKGGNEMIIDVKGKPMSRQGTLKINNELVAELTCH